MKVTTAYIAATTTNASTTRKLLSSSLAVQLLDSCTCVRFEYDIAGLQIGVDCADRSEEWIENGDESGTLGRAPVHLLTRGLSHSFCAVFSTQRAATTTSSEPTVFSV